MSGKRAANKGEKDKEKKDKSQDTPYCFVPHTAYVPPITAIRDRDLHLRIRQQPERARASVGGNAEKGERRPLDPPPVVHLVITNRQTGKLCTDSLYNPYYMCYASLWHADRDEEVMALKQDRHRGRSLLTGTIVVSMARLRDVNNVDSSFFPFTAIGVAVEGTFRLMFTLFEISGGAVHCRGRVYSESFVVYGRGFPGLGESTPLCRALAEQGVRIRLRNESKLRRKALKRKPSVEAAGPESSLGGEASSGPPSKKTAPSKKVIDPNTIPPPRAPRFAKARARVTASPVMGDHERPGSARRSSTSVSEASHSVFSFPESRSDGPSRLASTRILGRTDDQVSDDFLTVPQPTSRERRASDSAADSVGGPNQPSSKASARISIDSLITNDVSPAPRRATVASFGDGIPPPLGNFDPTARHPADEGRTVSSIQAMVDGRQSSSHHYAAHEHDIHPRDRGHGDHNTYGHGHGSQHPATQRTDGYRPSQAPAHPLQGASDGVYEHPVDRHPAEHHSHGHHEYQPAQHHQPPQLLPPTSAVPHVPPAHAHRGTFGTEGQTDEQRYHRDSRTYWQDGVPPPYHGPYSHRSPLEADGAYAHHHQAPLPPRSPPRHYEPRSRTASVTPWGQPGAEPEYYQRRRSSYSREPAHHTHGPYGAEYSHRPPSISHHSASNAPQTYGGHHSHYHHDSYGPPQPPQPSYRPSSHGMEPHSSYYAQPPHHDPYANHGYYKTSQPPQPPQPHIAPGQPSHPYPPVMSSSAYDRQHYARQQDGHPSSPPIHVAPPPPGHYDGPPTAQYTPPVHPIGYPGYPPPPAQQPSRGDRRSPYGHSYH